MHPNKVYKLSLLTAQCIPDPPPGPCPPPASRPSQSCVPKASRASFIHLRDGESSWPEGPPLPYPLWALPFGAMICAHNRGCGNKLSRGRQGYPTGFEVWPKLTAPLEPLPSPPQPQTRGGTGEGPAARANVPPQSLPPRWLHE